MYRASTNVRWKQIAKPLRLLKRLNRLSSARIQPKVGPIKHTKWLTRLAAADGCGW
jgi:hypothetical protein